jgi:uncharacterized protein YjbI with pentapeptide repeats
MSKPGKSFENNKRIILTKLENTVCGNMERLCSKPILDGYNARLRELGIRINIYDFYIKKGDGYKLKKKYKQILHQKLNKKKQKKSLEDAKEIQKKSLEDAKEIQKKLIELDSETKKKIELLEKDIQQKFQESLKKEQEEQEYAERLMRRLDELNSDDKKETRGLSGTVINTQEEVNKILKRKNNNNSETMKPTEIRQIAKDTNIPYKKIALALGLTGVGGGLLYMNTRKGKKKRKVKKRKVKKRKARFGAGPPLYSPTSPYYGETNMSSSHNQRRQTQALTLDRYKVQVKNTIKKSLQKIKKVKNYHLKVRGCFKAQHLKGKNLANFLRYYKEQKIYNKQLEDKLNEYINKRLKLFNDKYKKMQKIYNNLRYTTSANRLDFLSIMQHPALTKEEKNFILKEINKTENYDENMRSHFIRIVEKLYPIPTIFKDFTLEQISNILIDDDMSLLIDGIDIYQPTVEQYREQVTEIIREVKYFRRNTPTILYNKERLDEIISDVYKKDITEEYVEKFLYKEMKKNGLFIDKDGILKMQKNSPIIQKIRKDFRIELLKEEHNKFKKQGRLKDFSYVDLPGIKLNEGRFSNCNFKNANLKGASLEFCGLDDAILAGANLEGANLTSAGLGGAYLHKANLKGTKIRQANLEGTKLQGANLEGADLREAEMQKSNFKNANLKGASLEFCTLKWANLEVANLKGANLKGADLQFCILKGANLEGANLEGADLHETELSGANLKGARLYKVTGCDSHIFDTNLEGADLREAYLGHSEMQRSNLKGAKLKKANLEQVDLQDAKLKGADLTEAYLEWTDFRGAVLQGANLKGAILYKADLRGANLQGANLKGARYDDETRFQRGFNPEERGMTKENPLSSESQYDTSLQPDEDMY